MPASSRPKDDVIQIRTSAETKALFNRAAALRGQKLSEFMLASARQEAEAAILDQRTFFLDEEAHARFLDLLDAPPAPSTEARAPEPESAVGGVRTAALPLCPPEPLGPTHDVSGFANGVHPSLDAWLRERACVSEGLSARTYVVCPADTPTRAIGYFSISTALETRQALPSARLRRGMPDQVPLLLIGRLAVDAGWRGRGLASALLADALRRCLAASGIAGVRGVVAHAIDEDAARFYENHGFVRSPLGERFMLMPIETVRTLLGA